MRAEELIASSTGDLRISVALRLLLALLGTYAGRKVTNPQRLPAQARSGFKAAENRRNQRITHLSTFFRQVTQRCSSYISIKNTSWPSQCVGRNKASSGMVSEKESSGLMKPNITLRRSTDTRELGTQDVRARMWFVVVRSRLPARSGATQPHLPTTLGA